MCVGVLAVLGEVLLAVVKDFEPPSPGEALVSPRQGRGDDGRQRLGGPIATARGPGTLGPPHLALLSNTLELSAVKKALVAFLPMVQAQNVMVCSDNVSVVSYINKQGGTR